MFKISNWVRVTVRIRIRFRIRIRIRIRINGRVRVRISGRVRVRISGRVKLGSESGSGSRSGLGLPQIAIYNCFWKRA